MCLPPFGGEAAGASGGEDGLAEAFEEGGNFIQPFLAGINLGKEFFQFGDYEVLFGKGGLRAFQEMIIL